MRQQKNWHTTSDKEYCGDSLLKRKRVDDDLAPSHKECVRLLRYKPMLFQKAKKRRRSLTKLQRKLSLTTIPTQREGRYRQGNLNDATLDLNIAAALRQ